MPGRLASPTMARPSARPRSCAMPCSTRGCSAARSWSTPRTRPDRGGRGERRPRRHGARLEGWPVAAEAGRWRVAWPSWPTSCVDEPRARLHFTHLSTGAALELVRRAKAAGLPVTCDVTPHHLALTDDWLAGARRLGLGSRRAGLAGRAARGRRPTTALRVNPPLRNRRDAAACLAALIDGTADAVATDHAPHTRVDKAVEFGLAANGISGIETAIGLLLAAVDVAGCRSPGDRGADQRAGRRSSRRGRPAGSPRARRGGARRPRRDRSLEPLAGRAGSAPFAGQEQPADRARAAGPGAAHDRRAAGSPTRPRIRTDGGSTDPVRAALAAELAPARPALRAAGLRSRRWPTPRRSVPPTAIRRRFGQHDRRGRQVRAAALRRVRRAGHHPARREPGGRGPGSASGAPRSPRPTRPGP